MLKIIEEIIITNRKVPIKTTATVKQNVLNVIILLSQSR